MKILHATLSFTIAGFASAQPINTYTSENDSFNGWFDVGRTGYGFTVVDRGNYEISYDSFLNSVEGGPTTAQMLSMFSERFIEHNGRVFTVKSNDGTFSNGFPYWEPECLFQDCKYPYYNFHKIENIHGWDINGLKQDIPNGLYEVIYKVGSTVTFRLLFQDEFIGQIVATSKFNPIEIIGVDIMTNKIYGYYPNPNSESGLPWGRKDTGWGTASDGSMTTQVVETGKPADVSGVSKDGELFHLWGWSASDFNYALDGVKCARWSHWGNVPYIRPAMIADLSGFHASSRGVYCPGKDDYQLRKWTWHSSGSVVSELNWEPAQIITRLSDKSNIYGISRNGNLLTLWNDGGTIRSVPILPSILKHTILSIGGLDDGYARGVFVVDSARRVFNFYWDGTWKAKEIPVKYYPVSDVAIHDHPRGFFGNHNGKVYLLYGRKFYDLIKPGTEYTLYRLDFVGGIDRYKAVRIQCGGVVGSCSCPEPCPQGGTLVGDHVTGVCVIGTAPPNTMAFAHADSYYYTPVWGSKDCPIIDGVATMLDNSGEKCYVGTAPEGQPAWMWRNSFYYTDIPNGFCPYKPFSNSGWDTQNCFVAKVPTGSYGFIEGQNFFTYPGNICPYTGSWFDSANCFVQKISSGVNGYILNNQFVYDACPY